MLRNREKIVLVLGAAAVVVILLLSYVVIPGISRVRSLSKASVRAEQDLEDLRKMLPELSRLDREVRRKMVAVTASANAKESPLARLTGALQQAGLPQSAFSLKAVGPRNGEYVSEEAFDLKVENLTYLEVVKLLTRMESGQLPLVVRSATLKSRYDDSKYLDATLRIGVLLPVQR